MPKQALSKSVGFWDLVPLIGHVAFTAIKQTITYPFRTLRVSPLYNDVLYAAIRSMLTRITIPQIRYLVPSTTIRYLRHCQSLKIEPQTLEVNTGYEKVTAHWLGSPDADVIVFYFHGGGYTQGANEGNFVYLSRLLSDLQRDKQRPSIAVLIAAYSLTPEATYPTQLREATALLAHLLRGTPSRSPSSILIAGDSAGGNLALALVSHILHSHPSPSIPPIRLSEPLMGILMFSPLVGFSTSYPSFHNLEFDMLPPLMLRRWTAMFLNKSNPYDREADPGPVSGDAYTEPCLNAASWWRGLPGVMSDVLVVYGENEVLADSIRELEKGVRKGWAEGGGGEGRVVVLEGRGEAHIQPIVDVMARGRGWKSEVQEGVEAWFRARLEGWKR